MISMQSTGRGQQRGECRQVRPLRPRQLRSAYLAAQHGDLMPELKKLRILRLGAMGEQSKPGHDLSKDQIQRSYRHGRRSCPQVTT
jgi:hypothetical protein